MSGPKTSVPIHGLFVKVFLWFWLTDLALSAIFLAAARSAVDCYPAPTSLQFAPKVADEAAHAYEFGVPQGLSKFQRGLMGTSQGSVNLQIPDGSTSTLP